MTPSSWDRVNALLDAVLTLPAGQRETFLQRECADDPALRREVQSLLHAHDQADTFLDTPAHEIIAPMAEQASQQKDALVGQEIDGYRILDVIGRGGMGVVYKAKNLTLDRVEALKVIAPFLVRDDQFLRRFQIEARALARIHHPNIVTVHTLRESELGHYLTMEYVDGQTLADVLEAQGVLPWKTVLPIFEELLEAFDYAHERGIIHRDIKPRNIMLTADETVKVMDFGLAKFYLKQDVTQTAGVSGTLCYMSPEQIRGAKLDQRSDLFSLGLTLYEMVSGQLPFDRHDSQFGIQRAIVEEAFDAPHRCNPSVPQRLSQIIMRALEKDPDHRYQRARDMLNDLKAFADDTVNQHDWPTVTDVEARREAPPGRLSMRWKRALAGAALLIALVGGGYAFGPSLWSSLGGGTGDADRTEAAANDALTSASETPQTQDAPPDVASSEEPDASALPLPAESTSQDAPPQDLQADRAPVRPSEREERTLASTEPEAGTAESDAPPGEAESAPEESQDAAPTDTPQETDDPITESSDEAAAPPSEEPPAEEEAPAPETLVMNEARAMRHRLQTAMMDDAWSSLPAPLVAFYREKHDDLSRKFRLTDVDVLIDDGGLSMTGPQIQLPVTVYIQFQQRGRDGTESIPIPATWTWETQEDGVTLTQVQ